MYFRVQKIIFIFFFSLSKASVVTDVTSDLFSETSGDLLAAFGDFNADKQTDLFVIRNEGTDRPKNWNYRSLNFMLFGTSPYEIVNFKKKKIIDLDFLYV